MSSYKIYVNDRSYTSWEVFDTNNFNKISIDINPLESKLLSNDVFTVNKDNTVNLIHSSVRSGPAMPAVLILAGNKTYGRQNKMKEGQTYTKKQSDMAGGKLLYKCIPDDKKLPPFLIPYEFKHSKFSKLYSNLYVTFSHPRFVANNFDIVNTPEVPRQIVEKYNGSVLNEQTRPINPQETVWTRYEEIFTSNYKLIKDKDYYDFLMKFDLEAVYEKQAEQNYFRHKTQGLYKFAANYKHGDVALAPIKVYGKGVMDDNSDNRYQFAKSNLKVIEAAFHKVPVIASDVPIYNHDKDWVDGKNILFINPDRQYKDWYKKIKYCINNPNHVKDMGEAAYELACKRYDIDVLSHIRADFYRGLIKEKQEKLQLVN